MSARSRMTMRMVIERNTTETGKDDYNNPLPPVWSPWVTVPCYAWSWTRKEIVDGNKTVVIEDLLALVPVATDITESDRVAHIHDRLDQVLFPGPLRIDAVQRMPHHKELILESWR